MRRGRETPTERGAYRLSDLGTATVAIICTKCDRRGVYNVARLLERHGDIVLPSLLTIIGQDCRDRNTFGQCAAHYESPPGAEAPQNRPNPPSRTVDPAR